MSTIKKDKRQEWIPELVYQENSQVPIIDVPVDKDMPNRFFVFEYKHTGEFEPGPDGVEVPIVDVDLHQYFNYNHAKKVLDKDTIEKIRKAFDLEDIKTASEKGSEVINKIKSNIE